MKLSKKQLIELVCADYATCEARGLTIDPRSFDGGKRYQQLPLGPYGTADLVNVRFDAERNCYHLQVIAVSTGLITSATYLRAKRHEAALREAVDICDGGIGSPTTTVHLVLIGCAIDTKGDFVFALNADPTCDAYTYTFDLEDLGFVLDSKDWTITRADAANALVNLAEQLEELRITAEQRLLDFVPLVSPIIGSESTLAITEPKGHGGI